jgi:glycosyltransferase involved in cell wall biosynthesis
MVTQPAERTRATTSQYAGLVTVGESGRPEAVAAAGEFLAEAPVMAAIPAHNEARFIGSVVLWAQRYVDLVLVIDDGSTDGTTELAQAAGALVVRHEHNRGKGEAVNTAFREARRLKARALVLLDGDGQHRADEIAAVLGPVLAEEADMAVGSRFLAIRSEIPAYRRVGQRALTLATNVGAGVRLTDSQSGFRAFSAAAIRALMFRGTGFSVESEMQFLMREHRLRVAEVPISVVYDEPAKRNPVGHGMAVLHGIVRLVSQGRPLLFFGVPGALVLLMGLSLGFAVIRIFNDTHQLALGYAMITVLFTIIGVLAVFTGLMLNAMRSFISEIRHHAGVAE